MLKSVSHLPSQDFNVVVDIYSFSDGHRRVTHDARDSINVHITFPEDGSVGVTEFVRGQVR